MTELDQSEIEIEDSGDDAVIGRAFRRSIVAILLIVIPIASYQAYRLLQTEDVKEVQTKVIVPQTRTASAQAIPKLPLVDVTTQSGIDFDHESGRAGDKLLPETMGGGVAVLDYNGDDNLDLLFVNSSRWPWDATPATKSPSRLYQGDGKGGFTDVSAAAGLDFTIYGMGVAVGDIDNDGDSDVYISAVGPNRLLRNDDGKFVDVTEQWDAAGDPKAWNTSCGFFDFDNDGLLDLFVGNYVSWSKESDLSQNFTLDGQSRAYGPPKAFAGSFSTLYQNVAGESFRDVSAEAGIQVRNANTDVPLGKAMGVAPVDVNDDGWIDLVVANDTVHNFLFVNNRDGTFAEQSIQSNIAFDRDGTARGAMGIDSACFRSDGTIAIGIGNFANEASALYMSKPGRSDFVDAAMFTGFGPPTRQGLTFGLFFFDIDLDGRADVFGANGHLEEEISKTQATQRYQQPPQLFWNAGRESASELIQIKADSTGQAFTTPLVGRGSAYGDFDSDGDLDIVIATSDGPPKLFRNDQTEGNHWLRLKLTGTKTNRDAIGAAVRVVTAAGSQTKVVMPTKSYLSQSEPTLTFGLGKETALESVEIKWPGETEFTTITPPALDQSHLIRQAD